jgi:hypothetical protein
MAKTWIALYRPGKSEPEACDFDRSDLISLALRCSYFISYRAGYTWLTKGADQEYLTRSAAWKRLRRRGWRIDRLPERFWEARP